MYISHLGIGKCGYGVFICQVNIPNLYPTVPRKGHDFNGRLNRKDDITLVEIYLFSGHILD